MSVQGENIPSAVVCLMSYRRVAISLPLRGPERDGVRLWLDTGSAEVLLHEEEVDMRQRDRPIVASGLLAVMVAAGPVLAQQATNAETGKDIAFDRGKGNCLACHGMPTLADAELPGNIGPPLIAMSARFPDRKALRDKIFDATVSNPGTVMPPFGRHEVLTEEEVNKVVDFVYGL